MNATGVFWDEVREYWVVEFDYRPDRQEQYRTQAAAVKRAAESGWRGDVPVSDRDDLTTRMAAEIRKHIAETSPDSGDWWYDDGRDGGLPEALAADLIAAGWVQVEVLSELSDIFNALVRKAEPWSTYTEGYNDAIDAAEQAILAARWRAQP